jgi:hypothetical protein
VKYVLEGSVRTEHGSTGWMIMIVPTSDGYGRYSHTNSKRMFHGRTRAGDLSRTLPLVGLK